jgi:hypothetical protein
MLGRRNIWQHSGGSYIVVEQPRGVKQGCETSHVDYQELTSM